MTRSRLFLTICTAATAVSVQLVAAQYRRWRARTTAAATGSGCCPG